MEILEHELNRLLAEIEDALATDEYFEESDEKKDVAC